MRHLLEALHILFAIFAIGPLVHAATTASRGLRAGDSAAVATSVRTVRIYSYASLLVLLFGLGLVQRKYHREFGDTWIWVSIVLYLLALLAALLILVPSLERAADLLTDETSSADRATAVRALAGRVAAVGGVVGLLFAVIVFLMVYKP